MVEDVEDLLDEEAEEEGVEDEEGDEEDVEEDELGASLTPMKITWIPFKLFKECLEMIE